MIRRYSADEYLERISALRHSIPAVTLSTDIIVGFPGETRQDFAQTLQLVRQARFVGVFGFKYSQRPFTPALKLKDDVDEAEKSRRLGELFELTNAMREAHLAALNGTEQCVLVEGRGRAGLWGGRTERNEIVHFPAETELVGRLVQVHIERANKNSLLGRLLSPATVPPQVAAATPSAHSAPRRLRVVSA